MDNGDENDNATPAHDKGEKGNQKATAKSLAAQAEAEVQKGFNESFKAWLKNKKAERRALQQRMDMLTAEIENASRDFDRGIWITPAKAANNAKE